MNAPRVNTPDGKLHAVDRDAILAAVAAAGSGTALVTLKPWIDTLAPGWGEKVIAVLGLAAFAAGQVRRILGNPTGAIAPAAEGIVAQPPTDPPTIVKPAPSAVVPKKDMIP